MNTEQGPYPSFNHQLQQDSIIEDAINEGSASSEMVN